MVGNLLFRSNPRTPTSRFLNLPPGLLDLFRGGSTSPPAICFLRDHGLLGGTAASPAYTTIRPPGLLAPPRDQQEQPMPQAPSSSPTVTVFRSPGERIGCGPRDHNSGVASICRVSSARGAALRRYHASTYSLHEFSERLHDVDIRLRRALCGGHHQPCGLRRSLGTREEFTGHDVDPTYR